MIFLKMPKSQFSIFRETPGFRRAPHIWSPLALIKLFKITNKSVLQQIANPDLNKYISSDLITCLIVEVQDNLLPVFVILVSDLKSKYIHVSVPSHSYVIVIPNNYGHH